MKKIIITLLFLFGAYMSHAQYENTKIKVGEKAPELEFSNPSGETLQLSKIYKHRVILLDFWASWCGPCRHANPRVVELYNQYKDEKFKHAKKGFTIVSVSLDKNKDAWSKAIAKDSLSWPYHMSDLGGWQSKTAEEYGVQYIPQSFLIDEHGTVIGKYNDIGEIEPDLKKLLKESHTRD